MRSRGAGAQPAATHQPLSRGPVNRWCEILLAGDPAGLRALLSAAAGGQAPSQQQPISPQQAISPDQPRATHSSPAYNPTPPTRPAPHRWSTLLDTNPLGGRHAHLDMDAPQQAPHSWPLPATRHPFSNPLNAGSPPTSGSAAAQLPLPHLQLPAGAAAAAAAAAAASQQPFGGSVGGGSGPTAGPAAAGAAAQQLLLPGVLAALTGQSGAPALDPQTLAVLEAALQNMAPSPMGPAPISAGEPPLACFQ